MSKALVIRGANFYANRMAHIDYDVIHAESISLSSSEIVSDAIGKTYSLTYTVFPSDAEDAVLWTSTDENVATVNDNGLVTIVGCGTCTISITAGNVSDSCSVSSSVLLDDIIKTKNVLLYPPNTSNDITQTTVYESLTKKILCGVAVDPNEEKLLVDAGMTTSTNADATLKPIDSRPAFYNTYGWVTPAKLAANCSKVRIKALDNTFGHCVLWYKSNVPSHLCGGQYIASRKPTETWSGYNPGDFPWLYGETEYTVPSGYDSVVIIWRAVTGSSPFDDFRTATDAQLDAFKIICE